MSFRYEKKAGPNWIVGNYGLAVSSSTVQATQVLLNM
jgi:hypothetical protein